MKPSSDRNRSLNNGATLGPDTNAEPQYKVLRRIGSGGFGITYLVEEYYVLTGALRRPERNKKPYPQRVIKELFIADYCERSKESGDVFIKDVGDEHLLQWQSLKRRAIAEATTLNKFNQIPGLVNVRDFFEQHNTVYTVLDFIEGISLEDYLKESSCIDFNKISRYTNQLLDTLEILHGERVYHMDIKPSNIMIRAEDDHAVLIDFGAALNYRENGKPDAQTNSRLLSLLRTQGKTLGYCPVEIENDTYWKTIQSGDAYRYPPEVIDLYSLAATAWRCATGREPKWASELGDFIRPVHYGEECLDKMDHAAFLVLLQKTMRLVPSERCRSAASFRSELTAFDDTYNNICSFRKACQIGNLEEKQHYVSTLPDSVKKTKEFAFIIGTSSHTSDERIGDYRAAYNAIKNKTAHSKGNVDALEEFEKLILDIKQNVTDSPERQGLLDEIILDLHKRILDKADLLFSKNEFRSALQYYIKALNYVKDCNYSKERIKYIKNNIHNKWTLKYSPNKIIVSLLLLFVVCFGFITVYGLYFAEQKKFGVLVLTSNLPCNIWLNGENKGVINNTGDSFVLKLPENNYEIISSRLDSPALQSRLSVSVIGNARVERKIYFQSSYFESDDKEPLVVPELNAINNGINDRISVVFISDYDCILDIPGHISDVNLKEGQEYKLNVQNNTRISYTAQTNFNPVLVINGSETLRYQQETIQLSFEPLLKDSCNALNNRYESWAKKLIDGMTTTDAVIKNVPIILNSYESYSDCKCEISKNILNLCLEKVNNNLSNQAVSTENKRILKNLKNRIEKK